LPGWLDQLALSGTHGIASVLGDPAVQKHLPALTFYVGGYGLVSLFFAFFTALLRTRVILVVSGCSQGAVLVLAWGTLQLGWGANGALWAHGSVAWLTALAYFFWLAPLLLARRPRQALSLRPALRLGVAAWLTNLATGALLKQTAIWLLVLYGFSDTQKGFFNLAFQLGHSAGLLLVAGLGFVGMATMAAAYTGENHSWLATSWRAVLKVQMLLGLPLLVFSLLNAGAIVTLLYGNNYAAVGLLLQLFLAFNIATRLAGGGFHQAALYVLGKQRVVVVIQWLSLALTVLLGFLFIPQLGPLGALIATGLPPVLVELAQLAVLWLALRRPYPLRFMVRYVLALLPPVIAGLLWQPQDWLGLAGAGGLFTLLLIGALLLVKPLEGEDAALLGKMNSWLRAVLMLLIRKSAVLAADLASPDVTS
jgi:O-antigen/teichoic acid export membrane protein